MTTTTIPTPHVPAVGPSPSGGRLYWAIADMLTVTKRNLIGYTRVPEAIFFSSVQPIMFVLLFRYVFGGAIPTPGYHYVQFLLPGIFVQTVAFGSIGTSIGLAEDLHKGLIERFRALPMSRWAVLAGRTTADLCRNLFVMALMTAVGYAVGFRIRAADVVPVVVPAHVRVFGVRTFAVDARLVAGICPASAGDHPRQRRARSHVGNA